MCGRPRCRTTVPRCRRSSSRHSVRSWYRYIGALTAQSVRPWPQSMTPLGGYRTTADGLRFRCRTPHPRCRQSSSLRSGEGRSRYRGRNRKCRSWSGPGRRRSDRCSAVRRPRLGQRFASSFRDRDDSPASKTLMPSAAAGAAMAHSGHPAIECRWVHVGVSSPTFNFALT